MELRRQGKPKARSADRARSAVHATSRECDFVKLRFTSVVAGAHARLASGWRAAPLPGGCRTLWNAMEGFRLHHPPSQDFPCRKLDGVMPPGPTNPTDPTQPTNPGTPTTAEVHSNALSGRVQQYFDETGNWGL